MKEWIPRIKELVEKEKPFAVARVVSTWRSSPRPVGSTMIILDSGEMMGSVSGGCVEVSVVKKALEIFKTKQSELVHYGIADDEAWEVGLSCGGQLDVFIQSGSDFSWSEIFKAFNQLESFCLVSSLENEKQQHLSSSDDFFLTPTMIANYQAGKSGMFEKNEEKFFMHTFALPHVMLLIGAAHVTSELLTLARWNEFQTVVIDPRDQFAKHSLRSTEPDNLYTSWPQEVLPTLTLNAHTYAVVLSHDPKIDDPALRILLQSQVAYVGALGSRKTHAKRVERLLEQGISQKQINKIDAPIGIDIGSHTAKEIALSIMAGIIKVKNDKLP